MPSTKMFKKAAVFTDPHFGRRSDSDGHNAMLGEFVDWFLQLADRERCDAIICLGDFFDVNPSGQLATRSKLGLNTIAAGRAAVDRMRAACPTYLCTGNHDMGYRNNRNLTTLDMFADLKGLTLVNSIFCQKDVALIPFLVGREFVDIPDIRAKYVMGHLELATFMMNDQVEAPDRGGLQSNHFANCEAVFSGHFHHRQTKINSNGIPISYIGNVAAFDMNDVDDWARGCMILEWDREPQYVDWLAAPRFHRLELDELTKIIETSDYDRFNQRSQIECLDTVGLSLDDQFTLRTTLETRVEAIYFIDRTDRVDIAAETPIHGGTSRIEDLVPRHLRQLDVEGTDINPELLVSLFEGT